MAYPDESEGRGGGTGPRYETTGEATTGETTTEETTTEETTTEETTTEEATTEETTTEEATSDDSGGEPTSDDSGTSGPDTPAVDGDALVAPDLESEGDLTSADDLTALANGEAPPDAWTTGASAETPDHPDGDAPAGDAPSGDAPSDRDDGDGTRS